ncbi:RAMP superfamily CRISPR-associated protein [Microbispora bryophytorum]|uniref:RAMP superfamily CRISPR-associated protein n=1 Tax=Microbispora bryophytorum TaxID=1460882 RepID=UPI0033D2D6A0
MTRPIWHPLPLRTVTPAFLGRFEDISTRSGEITFPIPSLRGVLAYWLRALAGPYVGPDIDELIRVESELFGAASNDTTVPSRILLRGARVQVGELTKPQDGVRYLMGPGLTDRKSPPARCVAPRTILDVRVKNLGGPLHADLFLSALWALRAFGGIGARTRRGFGTLALESLEKLDLEHSPRFHREWLADDRIGDLDAVIECVRATLRDLGFREASFDGSPTYPCFAPQAFESEEHTLDARNILSALEIAGRELKDFRHPKPDGWAPANPQQLPNTVSFREVVKPFKERRPYEAAFIDGALGLPIVYSGKGITTPITVEPVADNGSAGRRASPLWLRVTDIDNRFKLRSLAFYSEWLPDGINLRIKKGKSGHPKTVERPSLDAVRSRVESWFTHLDTAAQTPGSGIHP